MRRLRFPIPLSIVLFIALTLAGAYYVRKTLLERAMVTAVEMEDLSMIRRLAECWPAPVNVVTPSESKTSLEGFYPRRNGTALYFAVVADDWDLVDLLLDRGANPRIGDSSGGTPLHMAAMSGSARAVRALLEKGADADARAHFASPILFLEGGPDNGLNSPSGLSFNYAHDVTPLHAAGFAADNGPETAEVVRLLLDHGADVRARDGRGMTPLFVHAYFGRMQSVRALIGRGADVNAAEKHGWTPLHIAAWQGEPGVAEALLKAGARVDATTLDGKTPLVLAREARSRAPSAETALKSDQPEVWDEVVRILLEHGAKE